MKDTKNSIIKRAYWYQALFVAFLLAIWGQPACGMSSHRPGLISALPSAISLSALRPQSCLHVKARCKFVTRVLLRTFVFRPTRWVCGLVLQHPKKILGTVFVVGVVAGGYHWLSKMTGKGFTLLDNHEKRVTEDIDAFGQVGKGAKGLREVNGALQSDINSGFDNLEGDTQNFQNLLTEFGDSLQRSLDTLSGSVHELAHKEGLCSLGREIGGLATDVVSVLESQAGGVRQGLKKIGGV